MIINSRAISFNFLFIWLIFSSPVWSQVPLLYMPLPSLTNQELAVIVNDADSLSVKVAKYYQKKRAIPDDNIIHISFSPGQKSLAKDQFEAIKKQVDAQTPKHVQAYTITWTQPYRVGCMSITTAFAAGYDDAFCAKGCKLTRKNPYFNSTVDKPFLKYSWRPTMALAGENYAEIKALIDRGVASDYSNPNGSAYLLKTSDTARSSRGNIFYKTAMLFKGLWPVHYLEQDVLENKKDVMFYFTGLTHVSNISSNTFLPGAVADHLTSTGGVLSGSGQMNILEWLKAGVTGSYGSVVEPCNFVRKFPNPGVLMHFYLRGNTLIEAYWKSVASPGQGIFVGEPLAKPFAFK